MRIAALIIALVGTLLGASACFEPNLPTVAFRCGDGGLCPDDYYCGDDGCCHENGSSPDEHGACLILPDAAVQTEDASP